MSYDCCDIVKPACLNKLVQPTLNSTHSEILSSLNITTYIKWPKTLAHKMTSWFRQDPLH